MLKNWIGSKINSILSEKISSVSQKKGIGSVKNHLVGSKNYPYGLNNFR
jgi:hypothetical protein